MPFRSAAPTLRFAGAHLSGLKFLAVHQKGVGKVQQAVPPGSLTGCHLPSAAIYAFLFSSVLAKRAANALRGRSALNAACVLYS